MMIRLPTKDEIKTLKSFKKPNCLTIYSPYIIPNTSENPNKTQLKNFLKEARQTLATKHLNPPEIDALLLPATKLLDSEEFQSKQNYKHSLAVFIGPDFFRYYHLPVEGIKPSMIIGKQFDLKPILDLLDDNPSYFVLMLSHHGVQLLKGDHYDIEQIQDFPVAMEEDLNIDEYPRETQPHMVAPAGSKGSERFHEQYDQTHVDKMLLSKYFRHINQKLRKILKGEKTPMIVAGVDYLLPIFREVNTYPHILANEIKGNLGHCALDSIKNQAYNILATAK